MAIIKSPATHPNDFTYTGNNSTCHSWSEKEKNNRTNNKNNVTNQIQSTNPQWGQRTNTTKLNSNQNVQNSRGSFESSFNHVLKKEGGLVRDSGGLTNKGISERFLRRTDEWKNKTQEEREKFIRSISDEQAKQLYKKYFWDQYKLENFPEVMKESLFSAYVNMSPVLVNKAIQRTVGNNPDGKIGAKTMESVKKYNGDFNKDFTISMLKNYSDLGVKTITTEGDDKGKKHEIYMNGWWNRFVGDDIFGSGKTKINLRNFSPEEQYQIASAYDGTAQSLKIKAQEIQTAKNKGK